LKAKVRLILLDSSVGKFGLMSYHNPPFEEMEVDKNRTRIRFGEPILVLGTEDIAGVYARAVEQGASIVSAPVDWTVPTPDGSSVTHLRTVSLFDPNGIYMEISQR